LHDLCQYFSIPAAEISNLKIHRYIILFGQLLILSEWQKKRKERRKQERNDKKKVGEKKIRGMKE
jgi:hypothetical protein